MARSLRWCGEQPGGLRSTRVSGRVESCSLAVLIDLAFGSGMVMTVLRLHCVSYCFFFFGGFCRPSSMYLRASDPIPKFRISTHLTTTSSYIHQDQWIDAEIHGKSTSFRVPCAPFRFRLGDVDHSVWFLSCLIMKTVNNTNYKPL